MRVRLASASGVRAGQVQNEVPVRLGQGRQHRWVLSRLGMGTRATTPNAFLCDR